MKLYTIAAKALTQKNLRELREIKIYYPPQLGVIKCKVRSRFTKAGLCFC